MAFLINDDTKNPGDSLRLYFDTTGNGGDPDTADRFFQIGRDGTAVVQAGRGSNSDGQNWNANYTSTNWVAKISESGNTQWVIEMEIDASAEMAALSNPFRVMLQALFTGDLATWPKEAQSNALSSYQGIDNATCSP
jgi:hypothetical protein